uniref:Uncharacterized protein n=1 Tax=Rhizophora mucronata TaxID=61149 RepID=A0A2P2P917_RHIMU
MPILSTVKTQLPWMPSQVQINWLGVLNCAYFYYLPLFVQFSLMGWLFETSGKPVRLIVKVLTSILV